MFYAVLSHIIIILKFLSFAFNFVLLLYGIVLYCSVCRVSRAGNGSMGHGRVSGSNGSLLGLVTWVMGRCMLTHDP